MKRFFFLVPLLTLLMAHIAYSQVIIPSLEIKMDSIFREYDNKGPGCAVAIISHGKVVFTKSYGMADMEHNIPISSGTIFDIASLAKQFTGLAISSLMQDGKISAGDDVRKYLPYVPDFGKKITINHLLHHTSGLRDWPEALAIAGRRESDVCSFEDIMRLVQYQKELDFEPGTRFSYSNTGYNLLAAIVEQVSGKTLAQWSKEHIFTPIKMTTSQIRKSHTSLINNLAESYIRKENEIEKVPDLLTAYGSSSLFTSLNDMTRWAIHFDEQVNRNNPVYTSMLETGRLTNGEAVDYGYGLGLNKEGTPKRVAHSGSWAGFRSIMVYYPDEHLSIIILSNSGNFMTRMFSEKIADVMLQREVRPVSDIYDLKKATNVKVARELEEKYIGTYQLGTDWYIAITKKNDSLMSRTNGESPCPMIAKSDTTYWVDAYNNAITFVKDKDQYLLKFGATLSKRITPFILVAEQLKQYTGSYYSIELATEYSLTISDGKLMMYHIRLGSIEMFPDPAEEAFGSRIGTFRFIKNDSNEITGFTLSGSRIRNIRFNKQCWSPCAEK